MYIETWWNLKDSDDDVQHMFMSLVHCTEF
jgi:hypothetical protein